MKRKAAGGAVFLFAAVLGSSAALFSLSGCAGKQEIAPLRLDNVLMLKAEREALERQRDREEPSMAAALRQGRADEAAAKEITPSFNPPELEKLVLPAAFERMNPEDIHYTEIRDRMVKEMPGIAEIWRSRENGIVISAGRIPLDAEKFSALSRSERLQHIGRLGEKYHAYYRKLYGVEAESRILDQGALIVLETSATYPAFGWMRADKRYSLFYDPAYRINFRITGKISETKEKMPELSAAIRKFQEDVVK